MNNQLKKEIQTSLRGNGYVVIVEDDNDKKHDFINDLQKEISEIKILSDYSLNKSAVAIKSLLQKSSVLLNDLDEKLEESYERNRVYKTNLSKKESPS